MNTFYEHHNDNIRFGYRCFDRLLLNGLIQPFQQPERVVGLMNATLKEVLALPDVKQRLLELGIEARPSSPDELMTLFKADVKKWDDVIVKAGIEKK